MRKIMFTAAAILAGVVSVAAASQVAPALVSDRPVMAALYELNLSDTQRSSIREIVLSHRDDAQAERSKARDTINRFVAMDPEAPRYAAQVDELAQTVKTNTEQRVVKLAGLQRQVYGVLTADQRAKLPQLVQQADLQRHADAFNGRLSAAFDKLDLSDDQWLALHKIQQSQKSQNTAEREKMRTLWAQFAALDPGAAGYDAKVQSMAGQFANAAAAKTHELSDVQRQVYAVLTPAQRSQLISMVQNYKPRSFG